MHNEKLVHTEYFSTPSVPFKRISFYALHTSTTYYSNGSQKTAELHQKKVITQSNATICPKNQQLCDCKQKPYTWVVRATLLVQISRYEQITSLPLT